MFKVSVFIINFEHISHTFLLFLFVDFEQLNVNWYIYFLIISGGIEVN